MPNPSDSSDSGPSRLIAAVLLLLLAAGVVAILYPIFGADVLAAAGFVVVFAVCVVVAIVAFLLFMHVVTGD
jgi:hypothetical protein